MKKLLILIMLLITINCFALSYSEIKSSGEYYYGEVLSSEGIKELCEAQDKALLRLSENISVMVSGDFETSKVEINGKYSESVEKIMKTYSGITLKNLKPLKQREPEGWEVLYYLHQDSLASIYNARKQTIIAIYEKAVENQNNLNLSNALQWYYYSLILMDSIPLERIEYHGKDLRVEVADKIKLIIDGVQFIYERERFVQDDIRDVFFRLEFQDQPVKLMEFIYIIKNTPVEETCRDGRVCCRLTGASVTYKELDIEIQYRYARNRKQMTEVAQLWDAIVKPEFVNTRKVSLSSSSNNDEQLQKYEMDEIPQFEKESIKFNYTSDSECEISPKIASSVYEFLNSIKNKQWQELYESDTFLQNKITEMCKHNKLEIIDSEYKYSVNKTYEGWEVRSIPVYCSYPTLNRRSMDYLILDFNGEGVLQDVNFSVFSGLYKNYVEKFEDDPQSYQHRQILVKFLEKYRSAYLNRDIKTLHSIFADEAVIIVGRLLKKGETHRSYEYGNLELQPDVDYLQMTKEEFMTRQDMIFNQQQDICLGFSSCKFNQKNTDEGVYGISMRQQYSSTGYSDEGYLFLLVDFKESEPMIYVRSWQPSEWTQDQLVNLSNFRVTE